MSNCILAVAEVDQRGLTRSSREVVAAGRRLADELGRELGLLVPATGATAAANEYLSSGADIVYPVDAQELETYQAELFVDLLVRACRLVDPSVVLMCHSWFGCDVAPRLAYRLGSRWGAGCVDLRVDQETSRIIQTHLLYGGQVLVDEIHDVSPAVITVRPRCYDPWPRDERRKARTEVLELKCERDKRVATLGFREREGGMAEALREAEVVVTGGRGMGSADAFQALNELAVALGGAVGASKAAVDADWVPPDQQVGLSGVTVAPRLYFAVGVSGAYQHMAGCNKSKVIVAINKDPEAPIFRHARFGIVDEWQNLLPLIIQTIKSRPIA